MPDGASLVMLIASGTQRVDVRMSEPSQDVAAPATARMTPSSLFIVERRLPNVSEHQLAVLQTALAGAAGRFSARGDGVRYLSSIFLGHQKRLLSLFVAESLEAVRAVNEAALVPFASIEPAVELPNQDHEPAVGPPDTDQL
jgi:hypothetical protein